MGVLQTTVPTADRALEAVSKELSLLQMGRQLAEGVVGRVGSGQE